MKRNLHELYRFLAVAAVLCTAYPLFAMIAGAAGYAPLAGAVASLVGIGVGLIGCGFRQLLVHFKRSGLLHISLMLATACLLAVGAFLLLRGEPQVVRWLGAIGAAGCFLAGTALGSRSYGEILTESVFRVLTVGYLVLSLCVWLIRLEPPVWITVLFYVGLVVVYGLLHNQSNIERLTVNRRFTLDFLPERIRSYNVLLLLLFFVFFVAVFLLSCFAIPAFTRAAEAVRDFIYLLMGLPGEWRPDNNMAPPPENVVREVLNDEPPLLLRLVIYGFYLAVVLTAVLLLGKRLFVAGRGLFTRKGVTRRIEKDSPDYVDVVQTVTASEGKKELPDDARRWHRDYRRYLRMRDCEEKYRWGYSLAVRGLALSGLEVRPSDTPLELADKSNPLLPSDRYGRSTELYNLIRYGQPGTYVPGRTAILDEALRELYSLGRRRAGRRRSAPTAEQHLPTPAERARRMGEGDSQRPEPERRRLSTTTVMLLVFLAFCLLLLLFNLIFVH